MTFFSEKQFYHEETKRLLIAISNLFKGITISKKDGNGNIESEYRIPVEFGQKNKWVQMIRERPDLTKQQVQITLPRMVFEIKEFRYAPERKIGTNKTFAIGETQTGKIKIFNPAPYDVTIELHVMTKDQVDGLQVIEQLTPYFQPYLNVNFDILPQFDVKKDIPIVLNDVGTEDNYGTGVDEQRIVINTFALTAKMYFFGFIDFKGKGKGVIKDAIVDLKTTSDGTPKLFYEAYINPKIANKNDPHSVEELWG